MTAFIRFPDIQERGIAKSWAQLANLIKKRGFPRGRMIGANTRVWTPEEIDSWVADCPVENLALRGAAKRRRGRPGKRRPASEIAANP
jgi:predicted DNA-binding transcriptional regulator AlpA